MDTGVSSPKKGPTGALTSEAKAPSSRSRWLNLLALVAGLAALALGPLAGGLFVLLSLAGQPGADALGVTTIGTSMAALGLGVGGALAWAGYAGMQRRPSPPFRPGARWFWGCLASLGLALGIGQSLVSFDLWAPVTFPLFHVLGVTLPAIAILILVGRRVGNSVPAPTQRQVIGQLALGAFGATAISFSLEVMVAVVGLVIAGAVMALMPGGPAQLAELQAILADPTQLQDVQTLADWLLKPGVLLAVALLLVVVVPMIEEGAKSIGVPLLALWTGGNPTPARGWLWGIAVGTGFAIFEGLFNSAASLPLWAGIALLRVGATAMHATTAGLTGLGWTRTLASRHPLRLCSPARASGRIGRAWPLLGGYLASTTLHGLWNGLTVLMAVSSLLVMARPAAPAVMIVAGTGVVAGLTGLVLLTAIIIGVAVTFTLRAGRG